jgi:microcystin-dependent protein
MIADSCCAAYEDDPVEPPDPDPDPDPDPPPPPPPLGPEDMLPVGSIHFSISSTNPATTFGYGTWTAFGAGRMLIGVDSGDADFDTAEETGGAKTHTLATTNLPAHSHTVTDPGHTHNADVFATDANGANFDRSAGGGAAGVASTLSATTGITVDNTGDGTPVNHMPPFIAVYMWKRTA